MYLVVLISFIFLLPKSLVSQSEYTLGQNTQVGQFLNANVTFNGRSAPLRLKKLVTGPVNLFTGRNQFFLTVPGINRFIHLPFHQEIRFVDDGYTRRSRQVNTTHHIDTLLHYLPERPFRTSIQRMTTLTERNLVSLIEMYNLNQQNLPIDESIQLPGITEKSEMQLLVDGKMKLYKMGDNEHTRFFIFVEGIEQKIDLPFRKFDNIVLDNITIQAYQQYELSYQDTLRKYMADVPEVAARVYGLGVPTSASLSRIVRQYNQHFEPDTFDFADLLKMRFSIAPGVQLYNAMYHPMQEGSVTLFAGFMADVGYRIGQFDLRFGTGVLFPQLNFTNRYYKYPFRLIGQYQWGSLLPFVALSTMINSNENFNFRTYSVSAGLDIKVTRNGYITLLPELQFLGRNARTPFDDKPNNLVFSLWSGFRFAF